MQTCRAHDFGMEMFTGYKAYVDLNPFRSVLRRKTGKGGRIEFLARKVSNAEGSSDTCSGATAKRPVDELFENVQRVEEVQKEWSYCF